MLLNILAVKPAHVFDTPWLVVYMLVNVNTVGQFPQCWCRRCLVSVLLRSNSLASYHCDVINVILL